MPVKYELPVAQTSHLLALLCTVMVCLSALWGEEGDKEGVWSIVVRLLHMGSFSGWFGTQLWVTFFAGVTKYKYLPRHTFGYIQSKLFPKYFLFGTVLSSISMATYLLENPFNEWEFKEKIQVSTLSLNLLTVLANLLYFNQATVNVMFAKHKFEKEIGAGGGPGKIEDDKLAILNKNPVYVSLSKKFITLHTFSAIANLLALCAQGVHLLYIVKTMKEL